MLSRIAQNDRRAISADSLENKGGRRTFLICLASGKLITMPGVPLGGGAGSIPSRPPEHELPIIPRRKG